MTDDDDGPPYPYDYLLKGEFRLSDVRVLLDVQDVPVRTRDTHQQFAIALTNVDMFMPDSRHKRETLQAILKAWTVQAERDGVDPKVRYTQSSTAVSIRDNPDP